MKYLVVDDSKMARRMLLKALKELISEDAQLVECTNGQEAINAYKSDKFNMCFMDLTMPVMDGFEAIKQICEYDKNAKVIVISADIQEGSMKKAKESGALGFIKKPVNTKNLSSMLNTLGLK
ncbi:MAG: response regulator [Halarcobacter sp.]